MTEKQIIGLTGPSGSGKSLVSKMIKDSKIFVIDADAIAHGVLRNNEDLVKDLTLAFSSGILDKTRKIDRKKLASIVFSNKRDLSVLNKVIFPYIISEILNVINSCNNSLIILDAPTLIESGLYKICNKVVVVIADKDIRLRRIIARDGLSFFEANNRLSSQLSDQEYINKADFVVYNNGDLSSLKKDINKIFKEEL